MYENLQNIKIQQLRSVSTETVDVDILRLDLFHPVISGNKWFKLRFYLEEAVQLGKKSIATFGGAYSNHIIATACAAKELGMESIGFIRGGEAGSPTLTEAAKYGMELVFINREEYRNKEAIRQIADAQGMYWIMEGGFGILGAEGAAEILNLFDTANYSHIVCAVGTGTMAAGLIKAAKKHQRIIGISVLKSNFGVEDEILSLLNDTETASRFSLFHEYHFGGYAKQTAVLFDFMKGLWIREALPTDIVYTSKLLFGTTDLLGKDYFEPGSRVLIIHSGGLQGNCSVEAGRLPF